MHNKRRWSGAKFKRQMLPGANKTALLNQVLFNLFIGVGLQWTALKISPSQKDMLKLIVMHQPPKDQKILQGGMLVQCDHARIYYSCLNFSSWTTLLLSLASVTKRDIWGTLWRGIHRSTALFEASPRPLAVPFWFFHFLFCQAPPQVPLWGEGLSPLGALCSASFRFSPEMLVRLFKVKVIQHCLYNKARCLSLAMSL